MILAPIQTPVAEILTAHSASDRELVKIGVQLATPTRRGLLNRSGFALLLLLFLFVGLSWGQCGNAPYNDGGTWRCQTADYNAGLCAKRSQGITSDAECAQQCVNAYSSRCVSSVRKRDSNGYDYCFVWGCKTFCAYDSLQCVNNGGTWANTGALECNGFSCQTCSQSDTTWTEITCAYSPQRGQYLNVVNRYIVQDCSTSTKSYQYYSAQCDSAGSDTSITCLGSFDGVHVQLRGGKGKIISCAADGSCDVAIRKVIAGECENPNPPQPSSSSSMGESSSSENQSSDSQDTTGQGNHVIVDELPERLYDSLGAIHWDIEIMQPLISGIYDGVYEMLGNQYDMKENQRQGLDLLGDIRDAAESADSKLSTTNSLLNDIKNKNWNPSINVQNNTDVSGIQNRQDQTRDTLHNTNSLLEQIKGLLGSSGSDTIHVDTSKAPASIDSALKYWGNSNNRTYGAAGLDSSGWGAAVESIRGYGDSVMNQVGALNPFTGCDTTGGRKCDGSIIGSGGLSSASGQYRDIYHSLGDSLTNGAFGDSLSNWAGKFNNSRLSGGGSDNCPSVFTRTWTIPFAQMGSVQVGPIGTYVCAPIFGNVTGFALGRVLLRAIVAISCMWFLFKCATGFRGGNDGEDD